MTFRLPLLVCLIPVVIALAPVVVGLFIHRRVPSVAIFFYGIGAFIGIVFGPMLFHDRVVLTDQALTQNTGSWFAPRTKSAPIRTPRVATSWSTFASPEEPWTIRFASISSCASPCTRRHGR